MSFDPEAMRRRLMAEHALPEEEVIEAIEEDARELRALVPLASADELRAPSPTPFVGRPDPEYPELDSAEVLYIPKFLFREWGEEKFLSSGYYKLWKVETERRRGQPDLRPSERKRKK